MTYLTAHASISTLRASSEAHALIRMVMTIAAMKSVQTLIMERTKAMVATSYPTARSLQKMRFLCTTRGKQNSVEILDIVSAQDGSSIHLSLPFKTNYGWHTFRQCLDPRLVQSIYQDMVDPVYIQYQFFLTSESCCLPVLHDQETDSAPQR